MSVPDGRTSVRQQVAGMEAALERLRDAEATPDFWQAQAAVFEFLNWLASLDWRARKIWVPEGEPLGEAWYRRAPGLLLVPSLRYIRNSAQHDWTRVIAPLPGDDARLVWADPPAASRHRRGDERYRRQLAGRVVAPTLGQVLDGFRWLALILEPPMVNPAAAAAVAVSS